jgi:hypothetical protein
MPVTVSSDAPVLCVWQRTCHIYYAPGMITYTGFLQSMIIASEHVCVLNEYVRARDKRNVTWNEVLRVFEKNERIGNSNMAWRWNFGVMVATDCRGSHRWTNLPLSEVLSCSSCWDKYLFPRSLMQDNGAVGSSTLCWVVLAPCFINCLQR